MRRLCAPDERTSEKQSSHMDYCPQKPQYDEWYRAIHEEKGLLNNPPTYVLELATFRPELTTFSPGNLPPRKYTQKT